VLDGVLRDPLPDPDSAPNEPRAIFKVSDHVVLAIPKHYRTTMEIWSIPTSFNWMFFLPT
jgi:hypothetical protein